MSHPAKTRHPGLERPAASRREKPAIEFREDINGLRAFAVVAVVLYHFGLDGFDFGFGGGFAGVDVFFVISGFLMTGIILSRLEAGRFSLAGFYASRLRRILPALSALCAVLLALGYFWLIPSDYAMLGKHAAAAVTFVSNIVFKGEKGYFDAPSRDKWLLHTWSLSVEGQFYLLYPLALLGAEKIYRIFRGANRRAASRTRRAAVFLLAGLFIISLAVSVFTSPGRAAGAFFLLPARVWEFMAGALVYILSQKKRQPLKGSRGAECLGMALMLGSFFIFNSDTFWPGYACLMPVAGAALIILAARENSLLTGNAAAHWVGKWSYSIYLWHWPLFVGLGYAGLKGGVPATFGVLAAVLLGAASYAFIEIPARRQLARLDLRSSLKVAALAVFLVGAAGAAVSAAHGVESRVSGLILSVDRAGADRYDPDKNCVFNKQKTVRKCFVGPDAGKLAEKLAEKPAQKTKGEGEVPPVTFVLWGDSHTGVIAGAASAAAKGPGLMYSLGCPTIFGAILRGKAVACDEFNLGVLEDLRALPKKTPVIVVDRYAYYLRGANEGLKRVTGIDYADVDPAAVRRDEPGVFTRKLEDSLCRIAGSVDLYAVKPLPEMGRDVPKVIGRRLMAGRDAEDVSITMDEYRARNREVLAALENAHRHCGVKLLDPTLYLCKQGVCRGSLDKRPLYFDDNHLNEWGNQFLVPMFSPLFPATGKKGADGKP